jgi:uncharacterized protein (DUF362 family)
MAANEREAEILQAVEEAAKQSRRSFLGTAAAVAASTTLVSSVAEAAPDPTASQPTGPNLAAKPPAGFTPFAAPGRIVKVTKPGSLQNNKIYPKPEAAKEMLTKALTELTGEPDLVKAVGRFVHKDDKVCVKVNGIALRNHATNLELVIPFLQAMIEFGVPAGNITVLEQYGSFLQGTRISQANVPAGVKVAVHSNGDTTMPERMIAGTGIRTKFCRTLTESTAAINFSLIKDHSICGYTGCLKNMTHGTQTSPHYFHTHHASPQIAVLYAQDIIKSRVRLCITDAYQVMAHGGPLDKQPQYRFPYESVFATTDPVAMDTVGWEIVEKFRAEKKLRSLEAEGRAPAYIKAAADLGLGVHERASIQVKEFNI